MKRRDSMMNWSSLSRGAVSGLSQTLSPWVNESTGSFQAVSNDQKGNGGATILYDQNWEGYGGHTQGKLKNN